jgi:GntR family transcriptional regulator
MPRTQKQQLLPSLRGLKGGNSMEPSKRAGPETYALEDTLPTKRFAKRPLYLQVRDAIAQRIVSGEWKPNRIIPNESELARQFGVSSGTMRKALDLAESEHLLTRRQGWGTSVNDQSSGEQAARYSNIRNRDGKRIVGDVEVLEILETTANERDGRRLRRRTQERVHRIRRVWSVQGKPYMVEDVVMPAKMFPGLATREDASLHLAALAQRFGVLLGDGEERITVNSVAPDVAEALQVEAGTTVMRLDRVVCTLNGVPAEWRLAQCLMEEGRHYLTKFR